MNSARLTRMERTIKKMCAACPYKKNDVTEILPEERERMINGYLLEMFPDTAAYEAWRASVKSTNEQD